jgi:hypothetical protein
LFFRQGAQPEVHDMSRLLLTLGAVALFIAAVASYFLVFRLDGVIESQIEKAAGRAFGSKVEVGGVTTNLRDGSLTVEQISVANPPGFENPYAVKLNVVQAAVDYDGLDIKRVEIGNPEFYVEERGGKTNFDQLLQALNSGSGQPAADGGGSEPVIVVRHLRIDETRAAFESHTFDQYTDMKVDAIEMNNLRGTPSELAGQIARKVVTELSEEAASAMLKAEGQKKLDEVQKKVNDKLRHLMGDEQNDG